MRAGAQTGRPALPLAPAPPAPVACPTTAPAKPKKQPAKPSSPVNVATRADKILAALIPAWPALTKTQRATFAARYTDAKCEEWGGRTKSEGVLGDAITWAPIMATTLKAHPEALRRYSHERFAWYLACIRSLMDERKLQETKGGAVATRKAQAEQAEAAALAARGELLETLEELVDGNDAEDKALSAAAGATDRPDRIVASIAALATFARGALKRADDASKELVKSVGLTLAEVESAEMAAEALAAAGADKTMEGRVVPRDTPAVNRVEGRLLLEMKAAMRVFVRAHARNKEVPKLVPGDATRAVLAPRVAKPQKAGDAGAAAPATPDAPPGK